MTEQSEEISPSNLSPDPDNNYTNLRSPNPSPVSVDNLQSNPSASPLDEKRGLALSSVPSNMQIALKLFSKVISFFSYNF